MAGFGTDDAPPGGSESRWLSLFVTARLTATAVAALLLLAHRLTDNDGLLAIVVLAYGAATTYAAVRVEALRRRPILWAADAVAVLALILAGGQWRSPFYLLALTTLILPATSLRFTRALAFTGLFTAGYFAVAATTGIDWNTLETTPRLESLATHLLLPVLVGSGLAYSAYLLGRLEAEQRRAEQLALEAERRRIARELHDSAKQRVHAAHLVLSSLRGDTAGQSRQSIEQALGELEAAIAEMNTSLTSLRQGPPQGKLIEAIRERAARLEGIAGIPVRVSGSAPQLSPPVAAHVFHVVSEAISNAIRHAGASEVRASLTMSHECLAATVVDDGRGLEANGRRESHGLQSMADRAELIGGTLQIDSADGGGTSVRLEVPSEHLTVAAS